MDILEIAILVIAWIITLSWMYGMRLKMVTVGTALTSFAILIETILFTFVLDISPLHLLWLIPISTLLTNYIYTCLALYIPSLASVLAQIGRIYIALLLIGINKEKVKKMKQQQQDELQKLLKNLSEKKFEEINKKT